MYNYLSTNENYKASLELIENMNLVEQRLIDDFWLIVTQKLKAKIEIQKDIEVVTKYDDSNCEWFEIRKIGWKVYIISTDSEDVGITLENDFPEGKALFYEPIIRKEIENKKENIGEYKEIKWPCRRTFNKYHFPMKKDKIKILPEFREVIINKCVDELFMYINYLIEVCDLINLKISETPNMV
jgi:hypothetical protein